MIVKFFRRNNLPSIKYANSTGKLSYMRGMSMLSLDMFSKKYLNLTTISMGNVSLLFCSKKQWKGLSLWKAICWVKSSPGFVIGRFMKKPQNIKRLLT